MKQCRVIVIGCGSLGAPVTIQLTQSGVGSLTIVDDDTLAWGNISRHPLGAEHVGDNKAIALQQMLAKQFPHLSIIAHSTTIQKAVANTPDLLNTADLIIDITGNWAAIMFLNRITRPQPLPLNLLFAWMERHASVGHAVYTSSQGNKCIECGFDDTGMLHNSLTEWDAAEITQEPECGAVFDPYGATEVAHAVSLTTDLALDILVGKCTPPEHRIWVGRERIIHSTGGTWSPYWRSHPEFRNAGGLLTSAAWTHNPECPAC